jgi:hypothetical protein
LKNLIFACALATLTSGCDNSESGSLLVLVPIAVVAAPIILPIDAVATNATITQPVAVVSAYGQVLAGPMGEGNAAKQTFKTTRGTVRCTGNAASGPPKVKKATVSMTCSNGMRGKASFSGNLTVGYSVYTNFTGAGDAGIFCDGNYRASGTSGGPFLVSCTYNRKEWTDFNKTKKQPTSIGERSAAVSAGATAAGGFSVTYWIAPL